MDSDRIQAHNVTVTTTTIPRWTLSDRLHKARVHAGLTQAELAARLECADKTVWRIENADSHVKRSMIMAWAVACEVDANWLLTGQEGEADTRADILRKLRDLLVGSPLQIPGQLRLKVA